MVNNTIKHIEYPYTKIIMQNFLYSIPYPILTLIQNSQTFLKVTPYQNSVIHDTFHQPCWSPRAG